MLCMILITFYLYIRTYMIYKYKWKAAVKNILQPNVVSSRKGITLWGNVGD